MVLIFLDVDGTLLPFGIIQDHLDGRGQFGLHWKTRPIIDRAAGRAFAWVDDEITDADQEWVSEHHSGPALLLRVDPHVGLAAAGVAVLTTWISQR